MSIIYPNSTDSINGWMTCLDMISKC
jgi:hypothetical protein